MAFDGLFTHAIVNELQETLATGRVSRVSQPYPNELLMVIRAHRHNYTLLMSANPSYPRVQLTNIPYSNPQVPTNFTMTMRKYLEGAILNTVKQVGNDRIVEFYFSTRDEIGDAQELVIVVEIMARHSNVTLVNRQTGKIIDAIKHVSSDQNRVRTLLPGATFIMPPKQDKVNPYLPNQLYSDLTRQAENNQQELSQQLQKNYEGFGRDSSKDLADRLLNSDHLPTTYNQFLTGFDKPTPTLLHLPNNKQAFAAFPPLHLAEQATTTSYDSLSELLDAYYAQKAEADRTKELAGQVLQVINNELKKDRRKVKKLNRELEDAAKADYYRIRGEILTTYLGKLRSGMKEIELPNFYDDNKALKIQLQPDLSPSRNAQRYFTRYDKLKKSVSYVNDQLAKTKSEIDYFQNIKDQLDFAAPADVKDMKLELQQEGYLKKQHKGRRKQKVSKPAQFHTSDGTLVMMGKNNLQNDRLSFKIANKNDTWLHVKDIPGSHVVIRDAHPSDQTILEAAQLAAYFSKARDSDNVPVDYLKVKQLHKPNGAKLGFVTFRNQKTLAVTPHLLSK